MPMPPGYWMYEVSGVLRPAIQAYLENEAMTPAQIAAMRAYLRQWIMAPEWRGDNIDLLRATVGSLATRKNIDSWLEVADHDGIDPL
jgi:hypothetical protein